MEEEKKSFIHDNRVKDKIIKQCEADIYQITKENFELKDSLDQEKKLLKNARNNYESLLKNIQEKNRKLLHAEQVMTNTFIKKKELQDRILISINRIIFQSWSESRIGRLLKKML